MDENLNPEEEKKKALEEIENNAEVNYDDKEAPVEKKTSLGKVSNRETMAREAEMEVVQNKFGWHKINPEFFPSRGLFYPEKIEIKIKAADVPQVRHFSAIDEQDPFSVNEALNDLLITCTRVMVGEKTMSYQDLLEEDRIHVILEIRELTFPQGENRLAFAVNCPECDTENEIEIKNSNFQLRDLEEKIMKYYSPEERLFIVKTKDYGEIRVKPPTIGVMRIISTYIKGLRDKGKRKLDTEFIKCLAYMIDEWRGFKQKSIDNYHVEYQRWDRTKFSLMVNLVEWAKVAVQEEMKVTCCNKSCEEEVTAQITFPGGIKNLFVVSDFTGQLL
tara:strand:+ start:7221 stop:8216 length:996 start_codon:yes stop_codon:yes gene_type:complete